MPSLYEIDQEILSCVDEETGELIDFERFESLQIERNKKIESVALWIKNLKADALAYKAEKDNFSERQKQAEAKIDRLEKWLTNALEGQKFYTSKCSVSFRKSETVEIENIKRIPAELLRVKTTIEPDKTAIKNALNSGRDINGCKIVKNINVQIK